MTATNSVTFTLDTSGSQVTIPNATYQASGNITSPTSSGASTSLVVSVSGILSPATSSSDFGAQPGSELVLDQCTADGTTCATRTIALNSALLYDSFRFVATFGNPPPVWLSR